MARNFVKERKQQLLDEALDRTVAKVFSSDIEMGRQIAAMYRQNLLLDRLLRRAASTAKMPTEK